MEGDLAPRTSEIHPVRFEAPPSAHVPCPANPRDDAPTAGEHRYRIVYASVTQSPATIHPNGSGNG